MSRPRLAEAVALASGWSVRDCDALLVREPLLVYELGIDLVEPGSLARTPVLSFRGDADTLWRSLAGAGLVPYSEPERWFACPSCDGYGRVREDYGFVPCPTCREALVFATPQRITHALAIASDFVRVAEVEHRLRKGGMTPIAWRPDRGPGAEYRADKSDGRRLWALFPAL